MDIVLMDIQLEGELGGIDAAEKSTPIWVFPSSI